MTDKIYLTPAELLQRWSGVIAHTGTLSNWRNQDRGPEYVKLERRILYPIAAVEKYEQDNLHRPLAV